VTITQGGPAGAVVALQNAQSCRVAARVADGDVGSTATLGVRPEHLRVDAAGPFAGRVELFERLGPLSFAHLSGADRMGGVVAQLPSDRHVAFGESIAFAIEPEDAQLFTPDGAAYPRLSL
jgi:ABC-type sugar transport system ATPase subunit